MPDPRDDLIRRGDVLKLGAEWPSGLIEPDDVEALPADPVAAAERALAEAALAVDEAALAAHEATKCERVNIADLLRDARVGSQMFTVSGDVTRLLEAIERAHVGFQTAKDAYRSAVAGREAGR